MDISKYSLPNLPSPQSVLEDLSNQKIIKTDQLLKFTDADLVLLDAYTCYNYCNVLKTDIEKHCEHNSKMKELNEKLLNNLEKMKTHL